MEEIQQIESTSLVHTLSSIIDNLLTYSLLLKESAEQSGDYKFLADIVEKLKGVKKQLEENIQEDEIIGSLNLSQFFEWKDRIQDIKKRNHSKLELLSESLESMDLLVELAQNRDLVFLKNCSNDELYSILYWLFTDARLDKDGTLKETPKMIPPYYATAFVNSKDNLSNVLPMIEECFLMEESVKALQSRYRNLLKKVCDSFHVNYHPQTDVELLEKELLQKVWDLPFEKLTVKDIKQISLEHFRNFKFYTEWTVDYNKVIPCVLLIASYRQKYC